MRYITILLFLILLSINLNAQNFYTENFSSDPGFDLNLESEWNSDAGNLSFPVSIGELETMASSPGFQSVDMESNFTIEFEFYAEFFQPDGDLTGSISFSETPSIAYKKLELQLLDFDTETFFLKIKDELGNEVLSDQPFYMDTWYRVRLRNNEMDNSLEILSWRKDSPGTYRWETQTEMQITGSFSYMVLGKEKKDYESGVCLIYVDSVSIYGNYNTALINSKGSEASMDVFPNPAKDKVLLAFNKFKPQEFKKVALFNILGNVVLEDEINSREKLLNLNSLPEGFYFIKIEDQGGNILFLKRLLIKK